MLDILIAFLVGIGCTVYVNRNKEKLSEYVDELKTEIKNAKTGNNDNKGKKGTD